VSRPGCVGLGIGRCGRKGWWSPSRVVSWPDPGVPARRLLGVIAGLAQALPAVLLVGRRPGGPGRGRRATLGGGTTACGRPGRAAGPAGRFHWGTPSRQSIATRRPVTGRPSSARHQPPPPPSASSSPGTPHSGRSQPRRLPEERGVRRPNSASSPYSSSNHVVDLPCPLRGTSSGVEQAQRGSPALPPERIALGEFRPAI
jgi:hypothetical protein